MDNTEAFYGENGYVGPARAFERLELEQTDVVSITRSLPNGPGELRNRHLDIPAVAEICQSRAVVALVRALLGPDLLLWRSTLFAISSSTESRPLPWHQDDYSTQLECPNGAASHCSVQINLSDSSRANCVAIIPESHRWETQEFERRGLVMVEPDQWGNEGTPVYAVPKDTPMLDMPLAAGEFYVFHPRLLHASKLRFAPHPRERDDSTRYAISLRIATTDTKVLPEAFARTPSRAECVLLSGSAPAGVNSLGTWAA